MWTCPHYPAPVDAKRRHFVDDKGCTNSYRNEFAYFPSGLTMIPQKSGDLKEETLQHLHNSHKAVFMGIYECSVIGWLVA